MNEPTYWRTEAERGAMNVPEYAVSERTYSWGTLVELFKNGRLVMFVDVYNDGTYGVYEQEKA